MSRRRWVRLGSVLLGLGCATPAPTSRVRTFALPAPELTQPAFESHVAVDPANPDRIVIGAHHGVGYNRGGKKIWAWVSEDGGKQWTGAELPLPRAEAVLAADVVTAFAADGSAWLTFLFADSAFHGGAAITRTGTDNLAFGPAEIVVSDRLSEGGGAVDKGWLAVDRNRTSPFFGTIYLTWHYNRPLPNRTVESTFWLRSHRAGAWSEPTLVAPNFSGQVALRSGGELEVVYSATDERTLLSAQSADGGRSFGPADTIVTVADSTLLDVPAISTTVGDTVVACWSEGRRESSSRFITRCAHRVGEAAWSAPRVPDPSLAGGVAFGYPAIAANPDGLWLLGYVSDSATTSVRLYRSTDAGRTFALEATLATRPFGLAQFCPAASAPCRRTVDEIGAFFPGDYFGLSAVPGRVAAAFTLPDSDLPTGRSTVYVSLVRP